MPQLDNLKKEPCDIVRRLVDSGYEAYIVGGAIRDLLLGVQPKDYDIATSASPEEVRAVFGRRQCRIIGRRFRLAHVIINREIYEVSTFRRRPNEQERRGRKSDDGTMIWNDNEFGTLEEDATRRDFTVNSLYYDVCGKRGIIDFTGGLKDLKKRVVRAIGDPAERFDEDPVRMIRALKLCGQYQFTLSRGLAKALKEKRPKIILASRSRLFEELLKIISSSKSEAILAALHKHDILSLLWPVFDQSWDEAEGLLARQLMILRGRELEAGHIHLSKAMALATASLPFLMSALNPQNMTAFWKRDENTDALAGKVIRLLFEEYALPKFFAMRIRDICYLVPRLLAKPVSPRALQHREYRHARKLLEMLVETYHWDEALLADLPQAVYPMLIGNTFEQPDDAAASIIKRPRQRRPYKRKKSSPASI
ncbi:MAG: polynucleotide adenylyltransferase PcnB [Lentisphaerae bacterium]|jgi:poly(A) polymerase|nr:polynucleotide adenylyltransferase PcnB [Lentisphaerota bacterium]